MQDLIIRVTDEFYAEYITPAGGKHGSTPKELVHWVMQKEARTRARLNVAFSLLTPRQKQIYECRVYKMKEPEIWE